MKFAKTSINLLGVLLLANAPIHSSTLMQYEIGVMTSSGTPLNGTFYFISYGADGLLNSNLSSLSVGSTSLLAGDDKWLFASTTANGTRGGNWTEYYNTAAAYTSGALADQKIELFFVHGLSSSQLNLTNGSLLSGFTIGASGGGGDSYSYGRYRTDSIDTGGDSVPDAIAWKLPANVGATATLLAYSGTGAYVSDINANLATSSSFVIVPEPSTGALMMIGAVGLVALRRLRKV